MDIVLNAHDFFVYIFFRFLFNLVDYSVLFHDAQGWVYTQSGVLRIGIDCKVFVVIHYISPASQMG